MSDETDEQEREETKRQRFIGFEEDLSSIEVPDELPVLPLRGVVIFPSAIVPLLISRGSSLKVVEQALAGDRMLAVVAQKNPEEEEPQAAGLYSRGAAGRILKMLKYPDGSVRILVQGLRRMETEEYTQHTPFFRARVRHLADISDAVQEPRGAAGAHGQSVRQVRVDGAVPARRAAGRGHEHQGCRQGHRPGRLEPQHLARREAGVAEHARSARAAREAVDDSEPRDRAARARPQDPVASAIGALEEPEGVLPAAADARHPEGARRGRCAQRRAGRAAQEAGRRRAAARGAQGRRSRARSPAHHPAGIRRAHRGPHLPRMAPQPAVERLDRGQPRHPARPPGARRGPLRPGEDQGPHPRVPRGAPAEARLEGTDPVLRRPAGHRQDVAGSLDRARHGAQVRAHVARRRARRGGDPRPPPHLHRLAAGTDHPESAQRRLQQPAVHARRDRQAGRRFPRRPGVGAARSARPRAEQQLRRSLPRRPVRPLEGHVHHHRQPARSDSAAAARPHGGHRAGRLHRGREARDRPAPPDPEADRGERAHRRADQLHHRGR